MRCQSYRFSLEYMQTHSYSWLRSLPEYKAGRNERPLRVGRQFDSWPCTGFPCTIPRSWMTLILTPIIQYAVVFNSLRRWKPNYGGFLSPPQ